MWTFQEFVKAGKGATPEALRAQYQSPFLVQRDAFPAHRVESATASVQASHTLAIDVKRFQEVLKKTADAAQERRVFALDEPEISMGRDIDACTIAIPHFSVSNRHCSLIRTSLGFSITDHGSKNGTFIGEERLEPETPKGLSDRDTLALGSLRFQYLLPVTFLAIVEQVIVKLGGRA